MADGWSARVEEDEVSQPEIDAGVACRWGRKRRWVKGEPANKEIHGVKWVELGFVEFRNVVEKIESEALERIRERRLWK